MARAVVEGICRGTHLVEHGDEQIVQWCILRVLDVTTRTNQTTTASSQQDGQVFVVVLVAVADATAVNDYGIVEQRAVAFSSRFHFLKDVRELLDVERVDL